MSAFRFAARGREGGVGSVAVGAVVGGQQVGCGGRAEASGYSDKQQALRLYPLSNQQQCSAVSAMATRQVPWIQPGRVRERRREAEIKKKGCST